jgi:hypothetical protein
MTLRQSTFGISAALCLAALAGSPAQAAWDNVFQPACNNCKSRSSYYGPVVAQASPAANGCQQCTTRYEQRCYYQPVTVYEDRSYYEKVTTYRTSYYNEPVCSYRYSCYYDPCTCSYKQVATPVTSYVQKAQCSPVESWVQRCCKVPVTVSQRIDYMVPIQTCTTTTEGAPIAVPQQPCPQPTYTPTAATVPLPPQPQASAPTPPIGPSGPAGPGVGSGQNLYYPPTNPTSGNWQPGVGQPGVGANHVAATDAVMGQVVRNDGSPRAGATLIFINTATQQRSEATTNDVGRFNTSLTSGSYYVYLASRDSNPTYHSQIQVLPNQATTVSLVNR